MTLRSQQLLHMVWLEDENNDLHDDRTYHSINNNLIELSQPEDYVFIPGTKISFKLVVDSSDRIHLVRAQADDVSFSWDKIYHSLFDGDSWSEPVTVASENSGKPTLGIDSNDHLHVFWTDNGNIYYSTTDPDASAINGTVSVLPQSYQLHPAFPNPFDPEAVISFDLPEDAKVQITVHDILGREVEKLVNGRVANGKHKVVWDSTGFPSGVYICRMTTGSFTALRKMLLLK